ncbi:MAG TPA: radical SAM protein [Bryobacteraceae bacterium]|nr:radical SAM protein [Bryobacteraceae bacterium]
MRLLLTHGYFLDEDPKERQIMKPYAPMGILYLSSHLRARGFEVDIYDSTFGSRGELFRILRDGPPAALGIYGNLMTRAGVIETIEVARAAGWRVIAGGPEPANYAEEFLDAGAEIVAAGEAELALEELMRTDFDSRAWPAIDGIVFRDAGGRTVRNKPARLLSDLDAQPWPDRERIDIPRYLKAWRDHHGKSSISVITARGCPYKCNWCSHSVYGHTHRRRSPRAVAEEVEWLLGRYRPDMLWMADDVFTIHQGWLLEYAAELKRRGIRIPFECITRADRVNERIAATLGELSCMRVWIGSESGSQRILDAMQRGVTVEQVRRAVGLCRENGIETGMFLMWGYDGEEIGDVEATVDHVKQCRPDVFFTTVSYPIRGTPYFDKVAARVVNIKPWRETTDREFQIRGRHSRRFYKYADDLLRSETAPQPDYAAIAAAREGLYATHAEVEA